jgi:hypothetical protein
VRATCVSWQPLFYVCDLIHVAPHLFSTGCYLISLSFSPVCGFWYPQLGSNKPEASTARYRNCLTQFVEMFLNRWLEFSKVVLRISLPATEVLGRTLSYVQRCAISLCGSCHEYFRKGLIEEFLNASENYSMISGSLSPRHGASSGCGWRKGLRIWRLAANMQSRSADKGWSSSLGVGRGANNSSP